MDIPRRLGTYEVLDKVGEGGMGRVYRARDRRTGERVAIKLLRRKWVSEPARRLRFLREAQIAQRVRHPNVVRVLDYGEVHLRGSERTLFLVMELLPGRDLYQRLSFESLDQRKITEIGRQLASALSAAHAQGVVHRDLKPGNVLVSSEGKATILDFGLAKVEGEAESRMLGHGTLGDGALPPSPVADALTEVGDVVGTPAYAPPEQLRGGRVTFQSDLYSLGALLYQMLTGRLPYRGNSHWEVLEAMTKRPPQPPSALSPGVASPLDEVVLRLLALEPSARFATADEVASALTEILESEGEALAQPLDVAPAVSHEVGKAKSGGRADPGWWKRLTGPSDEG